MTAITVVRRIAAPPERLFDAWLDPVSHATGLVPLAATRTIATVDARVGGAFTIAMHEDAGTFVHSGVFTGIDRPRRLAFTWRSDATHHLDTQVTVAFTVDGEATVVEVRHESLPDALAGEQHDAGWTDTLRHLALFVGGPT
jgi:uncharacterized protein YndB with AHSA1/START domain